MLAVHRRAAELAVDIVNAWRDDELDTDWVAALAEREPLPIRHSRRRSESRGSELAVALCALAEDISQVFGAADARQAAAVLNPLLADLDLQVSVSIGDDAPPHLHFDAYASDLGDRLRVNCLLAVASVLADPAEVMRIGECAAPSCTHVYVDHTRSARQRFCSRRCATRSHVSEHRRRQAARG
ncbi:CGNR zinc finger domain-containing protein [Solicola gregarius]|uniref:CGNR zinc finger domain-containing protein n=1 Tax=Solicola gregarius TaxID=2908642 RepID=A0AA46YMD4_9ACTN|nr:CGNR zinc finger domain-containing protein [Solicola gregarius]UYM06524.1 CGNR zinc finger domain-containing protein [Solicola gregarius]